jgi:hypothetical protein
VSYPRSRFLSLATAAYGAFCFVKPGHLADGVGAPAAQRPAFERMAYTYGARDLTISALGVLGGPTLVRAAMGLRVAGDVADAAILSQYAEKQDVRAKVLAVTIGWGVLNTLALVKDEQGIRRSRKSLVPSA